MNQPGIYEIVHVLSGKRYIGQTNSLERRWEQHQEALLSGIHHNPRLQRIWSGDGPDAFEFRVLEYAPAHLNGIHLQTWLMKRESHFIKTHKTHDQAFNIVDAELVETKASKIRPDPIDADPNHQITQDLTGLKPLISEAEQFVRTLQKTAREYASAVAAIEDRERPRFLGLLSKFSHAEAERVTAARVLVSQAKEHHKNAERQLAEAIARLQDLLARRKSLHQSYTGNQKRQASRRRWRSMF